MATGKEIAAKVDGKKKLVQGKLQTKVLIAEIIKRQLLITTMLTTDNHFVFNHRKIIDDLTCDASQFKSKRIEKR